jgi:aspartyl-tRNA(Asn)/glutamyl-tRNA(Gln) amidotransferase subunit A
MNRYLSYSEIREKYLKGELSVAEEVKKSFELMEARKDLNLFLSVRPEKAAEEAEIADNALRQKCPGRLSGMTLAVKDSIAVEGEKLTCGSKILQNFTAPYDATVITRLKKEGAIVIGKTNQDEFAMGSSNENSAYGPAKNPYDDTRVPGGSSGGSAGAVASGMCHCALGSDTGGSVRQPAAFCGVVGLRPTYGWFSRYGLVAFASSMDQIGPMARSVEDVAHITEIAAGVDTHDSTSVDKPVPCYTEELKRGVANMMVGLPREYFTEGLHPEIRQRIQEVIAKLKKLKVEFYDIVMPHTDCAIATYYILNTAEASSNLARYDGARYGYRSAGKDDLLEQYNASRGEGFGAEVKRRIMMGTFVLSAGYYEAYYKRAQKVRRLITEDFTSAFKSVDLIIAPVTPTTAFKLGEKADDPLMMYLSDIYTAPSSVAGVPELSVPIGYDSKGLPIGLGVIGPHFGESEVFRMGKAIENINEDK